MNGELGLSVVRAAAGGDAAAFTRIVSTHHAEMVRVAFVVLGEPELAQDAVQSAWSIVWRRLATHRETSSLRSWLLTITANEARQLARQGRRRALKEIQVDPAAAEPADPGGLVDPAARLDMARSLDRLSVEDRTLLALRFVAGLDSTEIARIIGGSPSGTRSRLSRLLQRLREDLK
jgi:RNA polymerase sigma-70 factor (ECF subfamily)